MKRIMVFIAKSSLIVSFLFPAMTIVAPVYAQMQHFTTSGEQLTPHVPERSRHAGSGGTWGGGVLVIPANTSYMYDLSDGHYDTINIYGNFSFDPSKNTKLTVNTINVYPGATFTITTKKPYTTEIIFSGKVDVNNDPMQMGLGLVAYGGTVNIEGSPVVNAFGKVNLKKGARSMGLAPWSANADFTGDELMFSDTQEGLDASFWAYSHPDPKFRQAMSQGWDLVTVTDVKNGVIYFDKPLAFDHDSYVADITRNIIFRSDVSNPDNDRGHVMMVDNTKVSIKNAEFKDLGRTDAMVPISTTTNPLGRYALHMHHLTQPFVLEGNVVTGTPYEKDINGTIERAIAGSPKWGIVNHGSNGIIKGNIVVGAAGSGIVGEDGTEKGTVEGNLVIGTGRGTGGGDDGRFVSGKGLDLGYGGFGYWFKGPYLKIDGNIAAGYFKEGGYGFFFHPEYAVDPYVNAHGLASFDGNIADGIFGDAGLIMFYSSAAHTVSDFTSINRNVNGNGLDIEYTKKLTLLNSTLTGAGTKIHKNKETGEIVI